MILETLTPTSRFTPLYLPMISTVQACLYRLRDIALTTPQLRIHSDSDVVIEMRIERNMLVALLGELNASMKKTAAIEIDDVSGVEILKTINNLRERVQYAEKHFLHTCADVEQVLRRAS